MIEKRADLGVEARVGKYFLIWLFYRKNVFL